MVTSILTAEAIEGQSFTHEFTKHRPYSYAKRNNIEGIFMTLMLMRNADAQPQTVFLCPICQTEAYVNGQYKTCDGRRHYVIAHKISDQKCHITKPGDIEALESILINDQYKKDITIPDFRCLLTQAHDAMGDIVWFYKHHRDPNFNPLTAD